MIYDLHLYIASPGRERFFVDSMRTGGLYSELARRTIPGFIALDLLRNQQDASEFLCLRFFTSLDAYETAQKSSNAVALSHFLSKLTVFSIHLGVYFTLPDRLIPRFPGASAANHAEKPSGDKLGPTFTQGKIAGRIRSKHPVVGFGCLRRSAPEATGGGPRGLTRLVFDRDLE